MDIDLMKQMLVTYFHITVLNDMCGPTDLNAVNGKTTAMSAVQIYADTDQHESLVACNIRDHLMSKDKTHFAFYKFDGEDNKIRFGMC